MRESILVSPSIAWLWAAHCCDDPVRHFGTFTDELEALAQWLCECGVRVVAMESTRVYRTPVYAVRDRVGFEKRIGHTLSFLVS